jgi:anti-sigma regulatory factor (Ser/Thr protein kinase)
MVTDGTQTGQLKGFMKDCVHDSNQAGDMVRVQLPRGPTCAALARRFVRDQLVGVADPPLDQALLIASELVTNALQHGQGAIGLSLQRSGQRVRLEVVDEGTGAVPAIRDNDENGGWGLRLVDQLALAWGCFEGTTHVWADISIA